MRSILLAALGILSLVSFASAAENTLPSVSTTGDATVYVVPDEIVVNLAVQSYDANLDSAKRSNEATSSNLVAAILKMGVEKKDISTSQMQVSLRYRDGRWQQEIEGYNIERGYAVTIKKADQLEAFIDTILKNGANRIDGISFQTTELRKYRDQARQMAIRAAKEKATALAGELGCSVGKPLTINEGGANIIYAGFSNRSGYGGNSFAQNSVQSVGGGSDSGENLPLGQIAVRATVATTFELK